MDSNETYCCTPQDQSEYWESLRNQFEDQSVLLKAKEMELRQKIAQVESLMTDQSSQSCSCDTSLEIPKVFPRRPESPERDLNVSREPPQKGPGGFFQKVMENAKSILTMKCSNIHPANTSSEEPTKETDSSCICDSEEQWTSTASSKAVSFETVAPQSSSAYCICDKESTTKNDTTADSYSQEVNNSFSCSVSCSCKTDNTTTSTSGGDSSVCTCCCSSKQGSTITTSQTSGRTQNIPENTNKNDKFIEALVDTTSKETRMVIGPCQVCSRVVNHSDKQVAADSWTTRVAIGSDKHTEAQVKTFTKASSCYCQSCSEKRHIPAPRPSDKQTEAKCSTSTRTTSREGMLSSEKQIEAQVAVSNRGTTSREGMKTCDKQTEILIASTNKGIMSVGNTCQICADKKNKAEANKENDCLFSSNLQSCWVNPLRCTSKNKSEISAKKSSVKDITPSREIQESITNPCRDDTCPDSSGTSSKTIPCREDTCSSRASSKIVPCKASSTSVPCREDTCPDFSSDSSKIIPCRQDTCPTLDGAGSETSPCRGDTCPDFVGARKLPCTDKSCPVILSITKSATAPNVSFGRKTEKRKSSCGIATCPSAKRVRSRSNIRDMDNQCAFIGSPVLNSSNFRALGDTKSTTADCSYCTKETAEPYSSNAEKCIKCHMQDLLAREKNYESVFNTFQNMANQPMYCCPAAAEKNNAQGDVRRITDELKLENQILKTELMELKYEMKHCLEKIEGPMKQKLETEKCKYAQLQKELAKTSESMVASRDSYMREMNALKLQLSVACSNMTDLNNVNRRLKEEMESLDCMCSKLEEDLLKQKLNEADTIRMLTKRHPGFDATIPSTPNMPAKFEESENFKCDSNLHVIARKLSKTLRESAPCEECSKLPELTGAAKIIKDLTDLVESRKIKRFSCDSMASRRDCSCQSPPATEDGCCQCNNYRDVGAGESKIKTDVGVSELPTTDAGDPSKATKTLFSVPPTFVEKNQSSQFNMKITRPLTDTALALENDPRVTESRYYSAHGPPCPKICDDKAPCVTINRPCVTAKAQVFEGVTRDSETEPCPEISRDKAGPSKPCAYLNSERRGVIEGRKEKGDETCAEPSEDSSPCAPIGKPCVVDKTTGMDQRLPEQQTEVGLPSANERAAEKASGPELVEESEEFPKQSGEPLANESVVVEKEKKIEACGDNSPCAAIGKPCVMADATAVKVIVDDGKVISDSVPPALLEVIRRESVTSAEVAVKYLTDILLKSIGSKDIPSSLAVKLPKELLEAVSEEATEEKTTEPGEEVKVADEKITEPGEEIEVTEEKTTKAGEDIKVTDEKITEHGEEIEVTEEKTTEPGEEIKVTDEKIIEPGEEIKVTEEKTTEPAEEMEVTEKGSTKDESIVEERSEVPEPAVDDTVVSELTEPPLMVDKAYEDSSAVDEEMLDDAVLKTEAISESLPKDVAELSEGMEEPVEKTKLVEEAELAEKDRPTEKDEQAEKAENETNAVKLFEEKVTGDFPFPVETEVVNLTEPPSGLHVTTTITKSGNLEVITEGPTGVIETALTYTEEGTIEVVTQITELSPEVSQELEDTSSGLAEVEEKKTRSSKGQSSSSRARSVEATAEFEEAKQKLAQNAKQKDSMLSGASDLTGLETVSDFTKDPTANSTSVKSSETDEITRDLEQVKTSTKSTDKENTNEMVPTKDPTPASASNIEPIKTNAIAEPIEADVTGVDTIEEGTKEDETSPTATTDEGAVTSHVSLAEKATAGMAEKVEITVTTSPIITKETATDGARVEEAVQQTSHVETMEQSMGEKLEGFVVTTDEASSGIQSGGGVVEKVSDGKSSPTKQWQDSPQKDADPNERTKVSEIEEGTFATDKQATTISQKRDCACQSSSPAEQSCQCCECKDVGVSTSKDSESNTEDKMTVQKLPVKDATEDAEPISESNDVRSTAEGTQSSREMDVAEASSLKNGKIQTTADELSSFNEESHGDTKSNDALDLKSDQKDKLSGSYEPQEQTKTATTGTQESSRSEASEAKNKTQSTSDPKLSESYKTASDYATGTTKVQESTLPQRQSLDRSEGKPSSGSESDERKRDALEKSKAKPKRSSEVPDSVSKLSDKANPPLTDSSDSKRPKKKRSSKLDHSQCDCAGVCQCIVCSPEVISRRKAKTGSTDPPSGQMDKLCCCTIPSPTQAGPLSTQAMYVQVPPRQRQDEFGCQQCCPAGPHGIEALLRSTNLAQGAVPKDRKRISIDDVFEPPNSTNNQQQTPRKLRHERSCECIDCLCLPKIQQIAQMKEFPIVKDEKQIYQVSTMKCECINAINAKKSLYERSRIPIATNSSVGPPKVKPPVPAACTCEICECSPCGDQNKSTKEAPAKPGVTSSNLGAIGLTPSKLAKLCDCQVCECEVCYNKPARKEEPKEAKCDVQAQSVHTVQAMSVHTVAAASVHTVKLKTKNCCCKEECTCELCPVDTPPMKTAASRISEKGSEKLISITTSKMSKKASSLSRSEDCDCPECNCPLSPARAATPQKQDTTLPDECDCYVCDCPNAPSKMPAVASKISKAESKIKPPVTIDPKPSQIKPSEVTPKPSRGVTKAPSDCDCSTCVCPGANAKGDQPEEECTCPKCECPRADTVKAPLQKQVVLEPIPEGSSGAECDCKECQCSPCADPKKRKADSTPGKVDVAKCDCEECLCAPCADLSRRDSPASKESPGKTEVSAPGSGPEHPKGCTCDVCVCLGKSEIEEKGAEKITEHPKGCTCDVCQCPGKSQEIPKEKCLPDEAVAAQQSVPHADDCICAECLCLEAENLPEKVPHPDNCTCSECLCSEEIMVTASDFSQKDPKIDSGTHAKDCTCAECKCPDDATQTEEGIVSKESRATHQAGCTCDECRCDECYQRTRKISHAADCKCGDCLCVECPKKDKSVKQKKSQITKGNVEFTDVGQSGDVVKPAVPDKANVKCTCENSSICEECYFTKPRNEYKECKCGDCFCKDCAYLTSGKQTVDKTPDQPQAAPTLSEKRSCHCIDCMCDICTKERVKAVPDTVGDKLPDTTGDKTSDTAPVKISSHKDGCTCLTCICVDCMDKKAVGEGDTPSSPNTQELTQGATGPATLGSNKSPNCKCVDCTCLDCGKEGVTASPTSKVQVCNCGDCKCFECAFKPTQVQPSAPAQMESVNTTQLCASPKETVGSVFSDPPPFETPIRNNCDCNTCACVICTEKKQAVIESTAQSAAVQNYVSAPATAEAPPFEVPIRLPCTCDTCVCPLDCSDKKNAITTITTTPPSSGGQATRSVPATAEAPPFRAPVRLPCTCVICTCSYCNKEGGKSLGVCDCKICDCVECEEDGGAKMVQKEIAPPVSLPTLFVNEQESVVDRPASAPGGTRASVPCGCPTCTCSLDATNFQSGNMSTLPYKSSHISGQPSHISGTQSHISGKQSHLSGTQSHISGKQSHLSGTQSHISGKQSHISGTQSHVSGKQSHISGTQSHSSGNQSHISGTQSHVSGNQSHISGTQSHLSGKQSHISGTQSHASGKHSSQTATESHISCKSEKQPVSTQVSHISGKSQIVRLLTPVKCDCPTCTCPDVALNFQSGKIPYQSSHISNVITEQPSHVSEKQSTLIAAQPSHISGQPSHVSAQPSHVSEKQSTLIATQPSHISGQPSHVSAQPSHVSEKQSTLIATQPSHISGQPSHISAQPSHVSEKQSTLIATQPSHISGQSSQVSAKPSHVSEKQSTLIGTQPSHISGTQSCISAKPSHVSEKQSTLIATQPSHISGQPSHISAQPSHVSEKQSTLIATQPSHISGQSSQVSAKPSHVSEKQSTLIETQPSHISGTQSCISAKPSHVSEKQSTLIAAQPSHVSGQLSHVSAKPSHVSEKQSTLIAAQPSHISGQPSHVSAKPSHVSGREQIAACDCPKCICTSCPDETVKDISAGSKQVSQVASKQQRSEEMTVSDEMHSEKCLCPECCACPSRMGVIDLEKIDDATLEKKIVEDRRENCECREQIQEIRKALTKIKCACKEAEMKAMASKPLVKQASTFGQTMSGLKLALKNLQDKCKAKDAMIEAMTGELKLRTSSRTVERVLNESISDAPDYDRADDVKSLDRSPHDPVSTNVLYTVAEEREGKCNFDDKMSKAIEREKKNKKKSSRSCKCGRSHKKGSQNIDVSGFEITDIRRITLDSIIIKWKPPRGSGITGYDIYINGVNKSKVMSGGRTSAMIHSLDLKATIQVTIYAVTKCGRCEPPAIAIYEIRP